MTDVMNQIMSGEATDAQIQDKLKNYPYVFPDAPKPDGTIIEGVEDLPRLGFWLMPNNVAPGMLEDFCRQLAPDDAIAFAELCDRIKRKIICNLQSVHQSKAVVHTYLACVDEIAGAASVMREKATPIATKHDVIVDTCGARRRRLLRHDVIVDTRGATIRARLIFRQLRHLSRLGRVCVWPNTAIARQRVKVVARMC